MDIDKLVDSITQVIMERLNSAAGSGCKVVTFGELPAGLVCGDYPTVKGSGCGDVADCDYVVMTAECFKAMQGGASSCLPTASAPAPAPASAGCCGAKTIDLSAKRLIHERDLRDHNTQCGDVVTVGKNAIITALAHDYAKSIGAKIQKG